MVYLRTKCVYVWTVLQTCVATALLVNGSHTIHHKPKFISFLRIHKENWLHWKAPGILCSSQVCGKLICHAPSVNCSWTIWFACVYWPLDFGFTFLLSFSHRQGTSELGQRIHGSLIVLDHKSRSSALGSYRSWILQRVKKDPILFFFFLRESCPLWSLNALGFIHN